MSSSLTLRSESESGSPYTLDPDQTLRAATALLAKIKADAEAKKGAPSGKADLLEDADDSDVDAVGSTPVWLTLTTKKHIVDRARLKPGKILLPHSLHAPTPTASASASATATATGPALRVCLITADPQRKYKDLVAEPGFPSGVASIVSRVIGIKKLSAKYNSFESKRQLAGEYDLFLADDRVITALPRVLGKTFYAQGNKRPVPVCLQGKKEATEKQARLSEGGTKKVRGELTAPAMAHEIDRATRSAAVHLAPSTSTSIRIGTSSMTAAQVAENITTVVNECIERFVPQKWRNVRAIHIKGPETAALPIWLASELWLDADHVLEDGVGVATEGKKRKAENTDTDTGPGAATGVAPGKDRGKRTGDGTHKRQKGQKSIEAPAAVEDVRKTLLKRQKMEAKARAAAGDAAMATVKVKAKATA